MSHSLDDPWPPFLDWVRSGDPRTRDRGLVAFWEFMHRVVVTLRPRVLSSMQKMAREDVLSRVYLKCSEGGLARYRNQGTPFSWWLAVVIMRAALDEMRPERRNVDLPEDLPARPDGLVQESWGRGIEDAIINCLASAPPHYRKAVQWIAEGLKPREILKLESLPEGWTNKKVGDLCNDVLKSLRKCLERNGINP